MKRGASPDRVILDFDATPISTHSENELAAGHYKGAFGFNPLIATCAREVPSGVLRPGNAGAYNAADHLRVLELGLEQFPESALDGEILARSDSAGASHYFASACRERRICFSLGYRVADPASEAPAGPAALTLPKNRLRGAAGKGTSAKLVTPPARHLPLRWLTPVSSLKTNCRSP